MKKYEIKEEYTRQSSAIQAGLITMGVIIFQALIGTGATDIPALISLWSFALAMPLLAALVMLNLRQAKYRYATYPYYLTFAYVVEEFGAFVGIVGAFWHVSWIAGVLLLVSSTVGLAVYLAYSRQQESDNQQQ
jgi:hypothetical protein